MSHFSDYIAQRRLDLQTQSQSLNERKFATEQANFERKLQADFENEKRRNEANRKKNHVQELSEKPLPGDLHHETRCQHITPYDPLEDKSGNWNSYDKKQLLSTLTFIGKDRYAV